MVDPGRHGSRCGLRRRAVVADADPVAAFTELRETGALDHTVRTRLVDGIIEDIYRTGV
jgi:hypothetical protein